MLILFWIFAGLCQNAVMGHVVTEEFCYNASSSSLLTCNVTVPKPVYLDAPDAGRFLDIMPAFAPTDSLDPICREHSKAFLAALNNLEYWALQMYDATAKPSSGLLNGNTVLLGDLYQCLAVDSGDVKGQYCLTTIYAEAASTTKWQQNTKRQHAVLEALDMMQSHNAMSSSYNDNMQFLPTFSPVTWAACVPASCSDQDVLKSLLEVLKPINVTSGVRFHVAMQPGACVTHSNVPLDFAAIATASFFVFVIILAIWGTCHEKRHTQPDGSLAPAATQGTLQRIILAFSFRKNMRALLDTSNPEDELSCVHGLRAVASLFIYLIHRSVFAMFYPFTNRTQVAEFLEGDWTMIFRAFWNWVDSFVVLSGLLTSFYAVKKLQEGKPLNIPRMYLQRYIKFTPMLYVLALSLQNLMIHIISAPQRIRIVDHYIRNCKRGLLPVVTYTNTFEGFENMCYPPSHQLATDMHMYLLAPFMILALWKYPKRGPLALTGLVAILAVIKYFEVLAFDLGSFIYYGISVKQLVVSANHIYVNAVHRLTPYIFGLGLGYLLRVHAGKCSLTRVQSAAGSAIALAGAAYAFYGVAHAARRGYVYDVREAAVFAVVQPILWSFAICWLIFCCATNQAPEWLTRGLSWKGFVVFSRLSYAVYLVQIFVIAVNVGNSMTAEYFRITKLVDLNEITAVMLISLLCTLLFLLPLQDLWNIATGTYKVSSEKIQVKHTPANPQVKPAFTKTDSWRL